MSAKYLSEFWNAAAPALGNHLWQSTVFAVVAGLLTLLLRKNHAGARYWLWLIASIKFLLPFSLLVSLGNFLSPANHSGSNGDFYLAVETVSQPFAPSFSKTVPVTTAPVHVSIMADLTHLLPAILAAAWVIGFLAVLFTWTMRWRRISSAIRAAVPVQEGREVETLRRLEQVGGIRTRIRLLLSQSSLEPGIFGIARPVLVWPEGISGRLGDDHLEAILAHEVWHVRRKDNLAAAVHMLVEAIFWFHPLVWWVGARLVEERERACDEEVLQLGNPPQIYAESILKICEFCVGSPLACVSGVTGADLKKRIVYIMNERISRKLDFTRKLLLTSIGLIAIALPVIFGLVKPTQSRAESQVGDSSPVTPGFISVSIRPGAAVKPGDTKKVFSSLLYRNDDLSATNVTLQGLIEQAYGLEALQIVGAPEWVQSELFDVEARVDPAMRDARKKLSPEQAKLEWQHVFQALLADRFQLVVHQETREIPGYSLVIAKNGPKLQKAKPGDTYADGIKGYPGIDKGPAGPHRMVFGYGDLIGQAVPIKDLAKTLSARLAKPVVDNTGLTGDYDFKVQWTPAPGEFPNHKVAQGDRVPDPSGPSLPAAIEEQLGLRLAPQIAPLQVVVIDRAEKPQSSQSQSVTPDARGIESAMIKPNLTGEAMPPFKIVSDPPGKGVGVMFNDNEYRATNITLHMLLRHAYGLQDSQISGGPDWLDSDRFDVVVKFSGTPADTGTSVKDQRRLTLQSVLSDRFKMAVHQETRNLPVYLLLNDANADDAKIQQAKLQIAKPGDAYANGVKRSTDGMPQGPGLWTPGDGSLVAQGVPIQYLLPILSSKLGGSVILDKTGLTGQYDFNLQFPAQGTSFADALASAVHDQLGLKLVPRTAPMAVLLVDRAEKPQAN